MSSDAEAPANSRNAGGARPAGKPEALHKLGRYEIERKLGAGGMGAVYLARDTKLRRQVALKVLPQDKANNPVLVRRFEAEAQAAAQLRHDNIVAVYDSGKADGYLYIAMEYVDGIDLHELVARRGTIPVKRSIEIMKQAAAALQHAAAHKIVHRDIKPSNLLIRRDGAVKITDLGLARSVDDTIETGITRAGTTVGTVDYMAPEQARSSKAADIRSDIYSLGCTWYHMLTGSPPYGEGSLTNKLQAHAIKPLPDPRTVNPNVTDGLVAVLHRMMAKKPEERYQTPGDLLKDLESPTLTQAGFSNEIFHAIEEEEAESARMKAVEAGEHDSERSPTATASDDKPAKKLGPSTLPPPRRKPLSNDDEQETGNSAEKLKLLAIVAGVIVVVGGLGWLMSGIGGLFDSPNSTVVTPAAPPPTAPIDPSAVGQATVAASAGPGGEFINGVPGTAPVFGASGAPSNPLTAGSAAAVANSLNPGATPISPGTATTIGAAGSTTSPPAIKLPDEPTKRPEAAAAMPDRSKLTVWTVGHGNPSATHFSSLNEALSKAVDQSVAIKLIGRGPYLLTHAAPLKVGQLVLMSDGPTSPLVVLSNSADGSPARLHVVGDLVLDGIHIVIDRQASASTDPAAMLTVENGGLWMTHSSLTAIHSGPGPLTAVKLISAATPPQVHVSQTAVRGEFDVGFDLATPSVDFLVEDSLFATGAGSALRLFGGSGDHRGQSPVRLLRSFSSTWVSRGSLIDLQLDKDLESPPETHVVLVDSVVSAGEGTGPRIVVNAAEWTQSRLRESVHWTNDNSALLGFETLLNFGSASSFKATDAEGWKSFWRQSVEPHEFSSLNWPTGIKDLSAANPSDFGRDVIPTAIRTTGVRGVMPGVPAERLTVPESVYPERMLALAKRTGFAGIPWATGAPVKIDLRKQDLGLFLLKGEWPDRAIIEASGFGVCTMSPVALTGKHVKVVFRQVEGGPLRVLVKETAKPADGLFQIRDGSLELEGLRWQVLDVKPSIPRWLISAVDSQVVLRDCELTGPDAATSPFEGVVRFETTATVDRMNPPQLGVFDSYLHAPGTLLRIEASDGGIFLHNSVLAARGIALDSRPRAIGDRLPLTFDLTNCTISAQSTVVKLTTASTLAAAARQPSRWYVDNCVFAPPIEFKAGEASTPTVLTYIGDVLERKELEWWGRSNGAAREIKYWLRPDGSLPTAEKSDHAAWLKGWGEAHELHTLTGEGGVVLRDPLPTRRDQIQVGHFMLRSSCKALAWAEGRPIGAVLGTPSPVGPKAAPKSTPGAATPKPGTPTSKPTPKTPANKKPGF